MSVIHVRTYTAASLPAPSRRDILRYAGARAEDAVTAHLLDEVLDEAREVISARLCYRIYPLSFTENGLDLGFAVTDAPDLMRHMAGSTHVVIMAATVGLAIDRLTLRYSTRSPARALLLSAYGTERVEALCDTVCDTLRARGVCPTARFSPGYGAFSLTYQTSLLRALDASRHIGVMLSDALVMSPAKSVSAVIGLRKEGDMPDLSL